MINSNIENRPMSELLAIVKGDFRKFDNEGLIDEGNLIKTVMYCNEKLGIPLRGIVELAIPVDNYRAQIPLDFDKLFYIAALDCSNTRINLTNPFDNNVDQDVIYKACLDRETLGCVDNYRVVVERQGIPVTYYHNQWTTLSIGQSSFSHCHIDCPNKRKPGKYQVDIKDGEFHTPFKSGTLYIIYLGLMKNEEGEVLYPFHPLITPYYEWTIKEKILSDAMFNSDATNIGELYKLASQERLKAWLDAYNFTVDDQSYGRYKDYQRKKELGWYNQWFKYFQ